MKYARVSLLISFFAGELAMIDSTGPCATELVSLTVASTEDADALSEALNCTGAGDFDVIWSGHVEISQTLEISDGTTLTVNGELGSPATIADDGAAVDGGGMVQLFSVLNGAVLNLYDVSLVNGVGGHGAAVYAGGGSHVTIRGADSLILKNHGTHGGEIEYHA